MHRSRFPAFRYSCRSFNLNKGIVQRLFSTFANGWPGKGLLLLRVITGATLIHFGIANLHEDISLQIAAPQIIAGSAGVFLLAGLWTPLAGTLAAVVKLWIAFTLFSSHSGDPWIAVLQAALGAALAMIGPGAWSLDARLFGRKHIDLGDL
jgi:putative oxidoreductase